MSAGLLPLSVCGSESSDLVGGKAVGLGVAAAADFPVPPGFVITSVPYREAVAGIAPRIEALLKRVDAATDPATVTAEIRALFVPDLLTPGVAAEIDRLYAALGEDVPVAVRSSATDEDSGAASFAGQQDTFLWVVGAESVRHHVLQCWASLYTDRAIRYRASVAGPGAGHAMAVVVQRMVPAESAGVMMTLDPASGDRDVIYIESAFGLGESVVRGEVTPDCFGVSRAGRSIRHRAPGRKATEYVFVSDDGEVQRLDVEPERQLRPSLHDEEVLALAELGARVETEFGRPMDIEWAIDTSASGVRELHLLQARPETVWARKAPISNVAGQARDDWDPLDTDAGVPGTHWTTANVGEAMPGVLTPLSWTTWQHKLDRGMRLAGFALGALTAAERDATGPPLVDVFHGRAAVKVDFFTLLGDRLPGTTSEAIVTTFFGGVPDDMLFAPTSRRYPVIAARMPLNFARLPREVRRFADEQHGWWERQVAAAAHADLAEARLLLLEAVRRHEQAVATQCVSTMVAIQPAYEALVGLVERVGSGDLSALSAVPGGPEMDVIADIWRASRDELTVAQVAARHGFHGPNEGELSAAVWREDHGPLQDLVDQYRRCDDGEDPRLKDRERHASRAEIEHTFLETVPFWQRPVARAVLALVRRRIPLRGLAKRSMLQSFDAARAASRRIGTHLVADGALTEVGDVFFLTVEELGGGLPAEVQELVSRRRQKWERYRLQRLPEAWSGTPVPVASSTPAQPSAGHEDRIVGTGVSTGLIEGPARVLAEPDFSSVEPGDILVAPHTDPSWSSVMFLSAGLVVDIGGALSHAAVVARELGLPCVVNTRDGTRRIATGDHLRVDGATGVVEITRQARPHVDARAADSTTSASSKETTS